MVKVTNRKTGREYQLTADEARKLQDTQYGDAFMYEESKTPPEVAKLETEQIEQRKSKANKNKA